MDYQEMDKIRERLGWSKRELAKRVGLGDKAIYGYYRNKVNKILGPVSKLLQAYDEGYRPKEE